MPASSAAASAAAGDDDDDKQLRHCNRCFSSAVNWDSSRDYDALGPRDGPPVLMLHGALIGRMSMVHEARAMADAGYRVLLPDLPGHGARRGERLDLASADAALMSVLRREGVVAGGGGGGGEGDRSGAAGEGGGGGNSGNGGGGGGESRGGGGSGGNAAAAAAAAAPAAPQKVLLVGFSMGGYVAAAFAAAHPALVAGAVLSGCAHDTTGAFWWAVGRFADAVYASCSYRTKSKFITG